MSAVVVCDGCGASRAPDLDIHGWIHLEQAENYSRGPLEFDACGWSCVVVLAAQFVEAAT